MAQRNIVGYNSSRANWPFQRNYRGRKRGESGSKSSPQPSFPDGDTNLNTNLHCRWGCARNFSACIKLCRGSLSKVELFIFIPGPPGASHSATGWSLVRDGVAACLVTTRGGRPRPATLQRQCWRRRRRRRRRRSRRLQTFHLELFSELQFLVFVALPYIIPAVNGNRKFRRDDRRHSRRRSDRSSPPTLRFLTPPMRFLWGTWSREIPRANNTTVAFNHLSKNYVKFTRGLERSYTRKDCLEIC